MPRTQAARRLPPVPRALLCVALGAALASQARAQASDATATDLDRITVTAQKREQQIQEVPISINAYSGDFLQANGINDYGDLGTLVPGLEVQTQSVSNPSISIRGITADLDDPTQEPRISLFQDGVSISRSRGSSVEMFDMERVEVLRGPQGTLFGRAAETGAIHLIQNKARPGISGGFQVGLGNFDQRKFTGFYNADLTDAVQGRVAAFYESRDGYMENLDGGTLQGKDTRAIRGSLHFNVGQASGLDLILNYQKDTPPGTGFRSRDIPNTQLSFDPYVANSQRGNALGVDREVYGATLLGSFNLNQSWSLSTITGWRRYDGVDRFDADGSQVNAIEFDEHAWGDQFSQEVRFNFDNGTAFTGFLGASYFNETASRDLTFQTDERSFYALLTKVYGPNFGLALVPIVNPDGSPNLSQTTDPFFGSTFSTNHSETWGNDVSIRSFEIFADGTWRFGQRWSLTAGLRGTREDTEYRYHADVGNSASIFGLIDLQGPGTAATPNLLFKPTPGRISENGKWNSWVGRTVLGYQINDDINTYASVSKGRRPNMINVEFKGTTANPVAHPVIEAVPAEIVWSYELGLKGTANAGRFNYDLSLYYYDYTNFQASISNAPSFVPPFVTRNAGKAHALGFEASLFARFTDQVGGFLNYGYINGGFNAFDDDGVYQQLAGNRFRMTPDHSVSVGLDWEMPIANSRSVFVRPSYSWHSHVYFEDENVPTIEQDAYGLFNLRAGLRFGQRWDLTAWVNNVTDTEYLIDAGNTGQTFGFPTVIPGAPRMFGVTLSGRF